MQCHVFSDTFGSFVVFLCCISNRSLVNKLFKNGKPKAGIAGAIEQSISRVGEHMI